MERKNVVLLTVIAVATLLTAMVGSTFAFFTASVTRGGTEKEEAYSVSAATVTATYTDTSTITLPEGGITPGWTGSKTITIQNTSQVPVNYVIKYDSTYSNGFTNLKYKLTSITTETNNNSEHANIDGTKSSLTALPTLKTGANQKLVSGHLGVNEKHSFTLAFELENLTGTDQTTADGGKTFTAKLVAEATATKPDTN